MLRLVAAGQTNKEIAAALTSATNRLPPPLQHLHQDRRHVPPAATAFAFEHDLAPPTTHAR